MNTTETPFQRILLILGFGTMVTFIVITAQWASHLTSPVASSLLGFE